ncbi:FimV/HubP family polar landmark protein [Rhodanobacter sp. L36]|uniref:FimV/HubP family polar landmark protein n=1 Tax=Rhodanobacter sp. L36 TaxID=1747221 RepID=UPI00131C2D4C|nr:FimV/HubP family polar landmark protein [Rhodanobacter sp. L36]
MNRSLKLSMLVALALGSSHVLALDLGQIQVKSALGQPLLAEIPLHAANASELKNLTVQLASSEDFARAGISGGRTAIPLHFSVASNGNGQQVIRITSSTAVDDPYLDLLLEVHGSAGKSVREFSILLDPPGTSSQVAATAAQTRMAQRTTPVPPKEPRAAAAAQQSSAQAAMPSDSSVGVAASPHRTRHAAAPAVGGNGQYGPVARGQTLSSIARNTAPAGVDVHQMLLALKQANPDAFYRDNINALKTGAVLRVPTQTEAQAMEVAAAVAEVQRENSDWRAGTTSKPGIVADAGTRANASSSPTSKPSKTGDHLALVPAKEGNSAGTQGNTAGAKGDASSSTGARQDLLRTKESLASLQQQSADLKTRLKDLTDINSKNERLLSLKDNEIAELQNKLAEARKAGGTPSTPVVAQNKPASASSAPATAVVPAHAATIAPAKSGAAALPVTAPITAASSTTTAVTKPVIAASSPTASAPAVVKPVVVPAAKPTVAPHPYKPTPVQVAEDPWYMQPWAWAVGAVVLLLLIVAGLRGRRRSAVTTSGSASSLADRFGSDVPGDHGLVGSEDVDLDELLDQLAEHPDDIGLHLELVTLYYSRRDVDHFEAAAEAMHAHITDPQQDEWQDVMHMGEDLAPGHPLFDHHPELPPNEANEARRAFDIDDYADNSAAHATESAVPPLPASPKKVSEYSFNFDLTSANQVVADADKSALADVQADEHHETPASTDSTPPSWQFDESEPHVAHPDHGHELGEFNDDPVDTKLDLARAYLDMGDADGARAMLGEVIKEGSQMQQDVAKRLLENLH